jgi:hypothetical protein
MLATAVLGFTVKLAMSDALITRAPAITPKSGVLGAPQGIANPEAIFPIHAILFFLSFLINYYSTAAL